MRTTKRVNLGLGLAIALTAALTLPATGQDTDEPGPDPAVTPAQDHHTTESGRPDLLLDMPTSMGGFEPEIVMTRGQEHFQNVAPEDPVRIQLEEMLQAVGVEPEGMVSGYALVSQDDFFAFVVGMRVDGAEPGALMPAYLPILIGSLAEPTQTTAQMGGKEVTTITSIGEEGQYVELYVYDEGDTVWMVQGPRAVAEDTIRDLPGPLSDG